MIASQKLSMANDIIKTSKSEVAMALKKAAPVLGIDGTTYHILDILIGLTLADDWKQDRRPLVAISNEKLAEYVCRSKRTVVRALRRLVEAGVLAYKDSPTGRRFIYRKGGDASIERGFGLDFSPARQRVHELKKIGAEFAEKIKQEKDAKREISTISRSLVDLQILATNEGIDFSRIKECWDDVEEQQYTLCAKAEALRMLHEEAIELFALIGTKDEHQSETITKMTSADDINVTPYNNTTHQDSKNSNIKQRSSNEDHINNENLANRSEKIALEKRHNSKLSANSDLSRNWQATVSSYQKKVGEDTLTAVSIGLLSSATKHCQSLFDCEISSWRELDSVTPDLCLLIGLSDQGWEDSCSKVGTYVASAVLITTAEKALRDPESIARPAGYFRACIDRSVDGKLALHKTLFGLSSCQV